ncbi:MAG TPA: three-Cys-motif partner protein TcmP [Gaiellaceae bacterium]|jgi:three-Cys-motif partner protein
MVAGGDFFHDPMWASLAKIAILRNYLTPFAYKLGSKPPGRVWLVDGFAGAGCYEPDENGKSQDGSPLASAKVARDLEIKGARQQLRTINVESDRDTFVRLIGNLAPYQHLCLNIPKTFEDALDEILKTIRNDPALFFLDPFGVNGIEMDLLDRIRERAGKTELLIHFSDRSVLRMAGNLDDNEQRKEVGQKAADAKVLKLNDVIGTHWWQGAWSNKSSTTNERIDAIAELYANQLRSRGFNFVHEIRMRDEYPDRPKYRLVFATRSPHGVELMSTFACEYERQLHDRHYEGSFELEWEKERRAARLAQLQGEIHALGVSRGAMTQQEILHELAPLHFGEFLTTEYHREIRKMVDTGGIDRPSHTGIKNRERLTFVEKPQQTLFGEESPHARITGLRNRGGKWR